MPFSKVSKLFLLIDFHEKKPDGKTNSVAGFSLWQSIYAKTFETFEPDVMDNQ